MNKRRIRKTVLEKSSGKLYDLLGFAFDVYYVVDPEDPTKIRSLSREGFDMKFILEEIRQNSI